MAKSGGSEPRKVRLPGLAGDEPVGLGDVVKKVAFKVGIRPCRGCEERARWLNDRMTFSRRS
jgi:hypothetical protein